MNKKTSFFTPVDWNIIGLVFSIGAVTMKPSYSNDLDKEIDRLKEKYLTTRASFLRNLFAVAVISVLSCVISFFSLAYFDNDFSMKQKYMFALANGVAVFGMLAGVYCIYSIYRTVVLSVKCNHAMNEHVNKIVADTKKK